MSLVQRDYILRLFEQMGQVIAIVIGLKKDGEPTEAIKVVSDALHGLVGFNLDDIERLSAEHLVQMIRIARSGHASPGEMVAGQLGVVGRLLDEVAGVHEMQGDQDRADRARLKALHLYLVVLVEEQVAIDDVSAAVDPLVERLNEFVLPFAVSDLLWRHYEQQGQYAFAEDTIFDLLETSDGDESVVGNGVAFFERLLRKDDADLVAGGLPRDEVVSALAELRGYA